MNKIIKFIKERFGWGWKKNYGFSGSGKSNTDWVMGGETGMIDEILQENGQWRPFIPPYEYQNENFETMACVTYSDQNCKEIILKRKWNENWDFSDRFTAKMSGTTYQGNSMAKVAESMRSVDGFVSQGDFLPMYSNKGATWNEYYKEIPQETKDLAKANLKELQMNYEWVASMSPESLKEALKYSPLQIAVYAYGKKINGVYQRIEGFMPNHCITLIGYKDGEYWECLDHYLGNEIRLLAWDYIIGYAMKFSVTKLPH